MNIQHKAANTNADSEEPISPRLDPLSFGSALPAAPFQQWSDYLTDTAQRTALFFDVLRQRADQQKEMTAQPMATVLTFEHGVLMSGSSLERPINFSLWEIFPPAGTDIDKDKRPVVIVDPRAGQGPGIGGFHYQSEIGDAFAAGHKVYFIGFSANPVPGQTFLDVIEGQVAFFERIVSMHPEGRLPFVVGNCQAGYQTLMVAILRPDLFGPILLSGSPISCWQGVHGKNPMRYAGGLLGGSWLAHLASDLGNGRFDGAYLIGNFDLLNPANTFFEKLYHVYANIDTEADRFLKFEKWWGDLIFLNGEEIEFLVDHHFIGNELPAGGIATQDGRRFDIRSVTSPIIVFTSQGDNISPPQQTLGWIPDLYSSVDEIRQYGQTIVYCVDPKVGHLAIFVSRRVAEREDVAFMDMMNVIDVAPPGLYELVVGSPDDGAAITGEVAARLETRTLDDVRAYGRNSEADDRAFAAMARWSEVMLAGYRDFMQPLVRATANAQTAEMFEAMNPLRAQYALFTSDQPWMRGVAEAARSARADRAPVTDDNPFLKMQGEIAAAIDNGWNAARDLRDTWQEHTFFGIYGNPIMQAMVGLTADQPVSRRPSAPTPHEQAELADRMASYRLAIDTGDAVDAHIRALLYVLESNRQLDVRSAKALQRIIERSDSALDVIKKAVRKQFFALELDREAAIAALPKLVPEAAERSMLVDHVREVVDAGGPVGPEAQRRLNQIAALLETETPPSKPAVSKTDNMTMPPQSRDSRQPAKPAVAAASKKPDIKAKVSSKGRAAAVKPGAKPKPTGKSAGKSRSAAASGKRAGASAPSQTPKKSAPKATPTRRAARSSAARKTSDESK